MAFSAALNLTDLNDFLGPSQICIKPVEQTFDPAEEEAARKAEKGAATEIRIDTSGSYYEYTPSASTTTTTTSKRTSPDPSAVPPRSDDPSVLSSTLTTSSVPTPAPAKKLQKAQITLNDCLACSGCITSAESVLVGIQSWEEVERVLNGQKGGEIAEGERMTPILSVAPQSLASLAALHSLEPDQVLYGLRTFFRDELGFRYVFDTTFARSVSLEEGRREYQERYEADLLIRQTKGKGKTETTNGVVKSDPSSSTSGTGPLPLLASACPGWICYAEKTHGELLPFVSATKSPQQVMGTLVKGFGGVGSKIGQRPDQIYHVSVMPCYDKKLEASRPDFTSPDDVRDVDCVLTTGEVEKMLQERGVDLAEYVRSLPPPPETTEEESHFPSLVYHPGSSSGSYLHNAIRSAVTSQPTTSIPHLRLDVRPIRGEDYVEYVLSLHLPSTIPRVLFKGAKCFGFRNLQNVVRKVGKEKGIAVTKGAAGKAVSAGGKGMAAIRARSRARKAGKEGLTDGVAGSGSEVGIGDVEGAERGYDFIEVMACPSGCVNGGGQIPPPKHAVASHRRRGRHVDGVLVDEEGMPVSEDLKMASEVEVEVGSVEGEVKVVGEVRSDGTGRVLTAKQWVEEVEDVYWTIGREKAGILRARDPNGRDELSVTPNEPHESIIPFFVNGATGQEEREETVRRRVVDELLGARLGVDREVERRRLFRTQYRAVESEEVNGLAVKW